MLSLIMRIINLAPFAIGVAVGFIFKPEIQVAISAIVEFLKLVKIL